MTLREAVIQAWMELGMSRETAELRAKASNGMIPDAAALTESPVKPGQEQEFIEALKEIFRKMEANPAAVQAAMRDEMGKRAKRN
jgi:hypothetical protein